MTDHVSKQDQRRELGANGEEAAVSFLRQKGFQVLERNYNQGKGEVDIVARNQEWLLFVEVRSATTDYLESPAATVNLRKQQLVIRGARAFLARNGTGDEEIRFDVVAVTFDGADPRIEWFQDAFRPSPSGQQNRFVW